LDKNVRLGDNTQEDFQTESMGLSLQWNLQRGYWLCYWHKGLRSGTALNPPSAGGQYYTLALPLKRKQTLLPPVPALLDHIVLETVYNIGPTTERGDIFTLNGLDFKYGLLRKYFSFASIEAEVLTMPSEGVQLF